MMAAESKSPAADGVTTLSFTTDDCPIDSVTVYADRAMVTRLVNLEVGPGSYQVVVSGLPACLNADSVRVEGRGAITLQEVSYNTRFKAALASDSNAREVARSNVARLEKELAQLRGVASRASAALTQWRDYVDAVSRDNLTIPVTNSAERLAAHAAFMNRLMDINATRDAKLQQEEVAAKAAVTAKEEEVNLASAALQSGEQEDPNTKTIREVTTLFEAASAGKVLLRVIYTVSGAGWKPAYDIRVASADRTLHLTYFGVVSQNTQEDWKNVQLVLSTATPSIGGAAPMLTTKYARFVRYHMANIYSKSAELAEESISYSKRSAPKRKQMLRGSMASAAPPMPEVEVATATVAPSSGASVTFGIVRRTNIESDNKPHRVTIAMAALESKFQYYAVPVLSQYAYLQAKTVNTSPYVLLASSETNVFFDNNFVAQVSLPSVSPGESFKNYLGVEQALRIDYRPVEQVNRRQGFLTKSDTTTYKYMTIIKNALRTPARLQIVDRLPRSNSASIKVRLVNPTPEQVAADTEAHADGAEDPTHDYTVQDPLTNNLTWFTTIQPGATLRLPYEFIVEFPVDTRIVIG